MIGSRVLGAAAGTILEIVAHTPGLPLDVVRTRAALGWGSFYRHLQRLHEAGMIQVVPDGRRRRLFGVNPSEEMRSELTAMLPAPRADVARRIAVCIVSRPGISMRKLVEILGLPRRSISYNLQRLSSAGYVFLQGGKRRRFYPTERLEALVKGDAPGGAAPVAWVHPDGAIHTTSENQG